MLMNRSQHSLGVTRWARLVGSASGDIRDLALGQLTQKKPATGMLGRLIAAMRGGF